MATCTIRFLYAAENREFTFTDVAATQSVISIKRAIVDKWPSGERARLGRRERSRAHRQRAGNSYVCRGAGIR